MDTSGVDQSRLNTAPAPSDRSPTSPHATITRTATALRVLLFSIASVASGFGMWLSLVGSLVAFSDVRSLAFPFANLYAWISYFSLGVAWIQNRRASRLWVISGTAAALLALSFGGSFFSIGTPIKALELMLFNAVWVVPSVVMAVWLVIWHLQLEPTFWFRRNAAPLSKSLGWHRMASAVATMIFLAAVAFSCIAIDWAFFRHPPAEAFTGSTIRNWPLDSSWEKTVELNIPAAFLQAPVQIASNHEHKADAKPPPGVNLSAFLTLYGVWPDLLPDFQSISAERAVPGGGRITRLMLTSDAVGDRGGKHYDHLQIHYDVAYKLSVEGICVNPTDFPDFPSVPREHKCYSRTAPDTKPSEFGLQREGVDFARYPDFPPMAMRGLFVSDIYTTRDESSHLATVIICTAEEAEKANIGQSSPYFPQCQHMFTMPDINTFVEIHYRRESLKDWQAIQSRWSALISSFVIQEGDARASSPAVKTKPE